MFVPIGCFGSPFCFVKISETCKNCKLLKFCEQEFIERKNKIFSTLDEKQSEELKKKISKEIKKIEKVEELDGCTKSNIKSACPFNDTLNNKLFDTITKVGYFKKKDILENFTDINVSVVSKKLNTMIKFLIDIEYLEQREGVYCLK